MTSGGRAGAAGVAGGALLQADNVASNTQPRAMRRIMGEGLVEVDCRKTNL
jgi:hypothetical protein